MRKSSVIIISTNYQYIERFNRPKTKKCIAEGKIIFHKLISVGEVYYIHKCKEGIFNMVNSPIMMNLTGFQYLTPTVTSK